MGVEGRKEFNREDLVELGLIAVTQEKASLKNSTVLQIKCFFSFCLQRFLPFISYDSFLLRNNIALPYNK